MSIFDIINLLLFSKKTDCEELDQESLGIFQPFLINRWVSFYSKTQATFVNETLNKYSGVFQDKSDTYRFFYNLIPRQKYSRIQYIKKQKNIEKNNTPLQQAKGVNISQREVNLYIELQKQLDK
jgi:hypothetical protein